MKWLPIAFVVLALAGCAENSEPETINDPEDPNFVPVGLEAPTWNVGDMWEYRTTGGTLKLAVTSDDGAAYTLDTNNTNIAFFEDQFDISYVGPIGKAHLSGKQGSTDVQYMNFPLHHNKEWTTTWDGLQMDMVSHDNEDGTFHIGAYVDGVRINQYQYSNITKFWDWISFGDQNGTETFRMDLISYQKGWTGELIRVDASKFSEYNDVGASVGGAADVEDADFYLQVGYSCEIGAYNIAIGPAESIPSIVTNDPSSDGFSDQGQCPVQAGFAGVVSTTPTEGNWGHAIVGLDNVQGTLWLREFTRITI